MSVNYNDGIHRYSCVDVLCRLLFVDVFVFIGQVEDQLLREQIEQYNQRLREIEDRQRQYQEERERQAEAEAEVVEGLLTLTEGTSRGGAKGGAGGGHDDDGGACGGVSGVDWS